MLGWSAYTLIGKKVAGVSTLAITTYAALLGTALLFIVTLARGELALPQASARAWWALVYMGTLGTAVAFVWFLEGVKTLGPARAAIFVNLVPVAAIALAALLLGERITLAMIVGGALVIAGVWIINRPTAAAPRRRRLYRILIARMKPSPRSLRSRRPRGRGQWLGAERRH